ncbi:small acid-soluble spore protein O [Bacillus sp. FJAT-45350]|uniref:small acid-soluble spore protein O n=1 Tax=Bacillus sp. FJAT-45350 TaxID=2011014 RepID=UPI000BB97FB5|nr:small acid-soluble spore protein O [Bacillus sp. FJAT-45350]
MTKKHSNHVIPGMNQAKGQGKGAGYRSQFNQEMANEPLTEEQRQFNKKTKKRQ